MLSASKWVNGLIDYQRSKGQVKVKGNELSKVLTIITKKNELKMSGKGVTNSHIGRSGSQRSQGAYHMTKI